MSASETAMCNMALLGVGAKPKIARLGEDSENGRLCNQFFWPVVDAVLRGHIWNCAIHRRTITPKAEAPDFDYDYQYQLPANPHCLRLLQVGELDDQPTDWKVEGRRFLYNGSSAKIVYIKRITDTNEFDPLLVDAITIRLQIKFAPSLTNSRKTVADLISEYENITLPLARTIDGQESSTETLLVDTWEQSRY